MRLGPLLRLLPAVVVFWAVRTGAQPPVSVPVGGAAHKRAHDELSERAGALLDLSRAVPPEFGADALGRIAVSPLLPDPRRKALALEEAFQLASRAQNALRMAALPGSDVDSRSGYLALAYEAGLDSLSLKCRVVRELIPVNRSAAKRLFGDVPIPQPGPLTCADRLVFDLGSYYSLLAEVARLPLRGDEANAEKPFDLMMREIGSLVSPAQVPLMVRAVREVAGSSRDMEYFIAALGSALASVATDYRAFSAVGLDLANEVALLSDACRSRGVSNVAFLAAIRQYFVRQLRGLQCGDSPADRRLASMLARAYNDSVRGKVLPAGTVLPQILESEVVPEKIEQPGPPDLLWKDAPGSSLERQMGDLRGSRGKLVGDEWRGRLLELISKVADWKPSDDTLPLDYFHEKCILLRSLLDAAPDAASREPVLTAYLLFLDQWDFQQNRIEWFLHARELLAILGPAGGPMRSDRIDAELNAARNPVLSLYIKLDALIPAGGSRPVAP